MCASALGKRGELGGQSHLKVAHSVLTVLLIPSELVTSHVLPESSQVGADPVPLLGRQNHRRFRHIRSPRAGPA